MNEIRIISVTISFIVFVLLSSANVCQSQHSNNADFRTAVNENNPAELIKSLIKGEISPNVTGRGARLSSYIMDLYNALEETKAERHGQGDTYPRIRSFRGLKGSEDKFTFQLSNVWNNRVKRVEIVIKLDRTRQESHTGNTATLFVHETRLSTVEYVSRQYSNYLIFDITSLQEALPNNVSIDKFLRIDHDRVRISRRSEPLLLVYENLEHNPLLDEGNRAQRQKRHVESIFDYEDGDINRMSCRRYDWYVELSIFSGLDWWLYPRFYNAGYCYGQCNYPLTKDTTNSSSYSFMRNVWHSQTYFLDEDVPRASCVPVDYEPLQIIHLTSNLEQDIMMIDDMIVTSCGCR